MEYFLSSFWAALELVGIYFFWNAFLEIKYPKKMSLRIFLAAWVFSIVFLNLGLADIIEQTISFILFIAMSVFCYNGALIRKLLCVILFYVLGAMFDTAFLYGTCAVVGTNLSELVWQKLTYSLVVTISKLITIFLVWITYRLRKPHANEPIRPQWLLLTTLFPAVSLGMLAVVFHGNRGKEDLSVVSLCFSILLALANIAIIYLFDLMEKNAIESKKIALLNQQMDIQTSGIIALEKNYRAQRKATHEHRNQLQTIHDLLLASKSDVALSYVQQLQGMQTTRIFTVNSHHPIIDAVLNQKYQYAQEYNIDVQMQVSDLSGVTITPDLLVVLLSNLLDNAIEACLRLPDQRVIQCRMIMSDSLYLSVRNTSLPVEITCNFIPTTKEPREDHGYGLPHIDFILNQLQAEYALSYKDGWFEFAAEIPHN